MVREIVVEEGISHHNYKSANIPPEARSGSLTSLVRVMMTKSQV
jgi:hypothetical protein